MAIYEREEYTNDAEEKISSGAVKYDGGKSPIYRGQFLTSLGQLAQLPRVRFPELLSTSGTDGVQSMTGLTDTLTQWYDTLATKEKEKFWILIVDFFMLPTRLGTHSRG